MDIEAFKLGPYDYRPKTVRMRIAPVQSTEAWAEFAQHCIKVPGGVAGVIVEEMTAKEAAEVAQRGGGTGLATYEVLVRQELDA